MVFLRLLARQDALRRAGFVDDVDGLVGQVAVVDVLGRQLGRGLQRAQRVLHAVVLLEAALEALEDLDRLGHRGLDHVDLLEAPRQRRVLLEDAAVLGEGGGADALELAAGQRGLSRLLASSVPPEAAPAPISVWISSMNRIAPGLSFSCLSTPFSAARSRRGTWCRPAARPCRARRRGPGQHLGHVPSVMRQARPSAMAVLPTPASPTSSGLFLRRRHRIWMVRSTS
jgi:hypothetical protein